MLRSISLHGSEAGSAVLDTGARSTSFRLHLRQRRCAGLPEVFLVSPDAFVRAEIGEDMCGSGAMGDARGMVLLRGTAVVALGANGMSAQDLEKAKERILLSLPQEKAAAGSALPSSETPCASCEAPALRAASPDPQNVIERENGFAASSEAGRRIRESARELFSAKGNGTGAEAPEASGEFAGNPFPRLFGRSARFYRVSDAELRGTAVIRGKRVEVAAVRIFGRGGSNAPHTRAFRAADRRGRPYWIVIAPGSERG